MFIHFPPFLICQTSYLLFFGSIIPPVADAPKKKQLFELTSLRTHLEGTETWCRRGGLWFSDVHGSPIDSQSYHLSKQCSTCFSYCSSNMFQPLSLHQSNPTLDIGLSRHIRIASKKSSFVLDHFCGETHDFCGRTPWVPCSIAMRQPVARWGSPCGFPSFTIWKNGSVLSGSSAKKASFQVAWAVPPL